MTASYERVVIESVAQWRRWLQSNHATSPGIWLVTWKKGHRPWIAYDDIVDQAICFGWVDSQPRSLDEHRSQRLLTPRRAGSRWSKVNKERVRRLQAAGQMRQPGLAAVQRAKADGTWTALDSIETLTEPHELSRALDANHAARQHWDGFPLRPGARSSNGSARPKPPRPETSGSSRPWPRLPSADAPTSGVNPRTSTESARPDRGEVTRSSDDWGHSGEAMRAILVGRSNERCRRRLIAGGPSGWPRLLAGSTPLERRRAQQLDATVSLRRGANAVEVHGSGRRPVGRDRFAGIPVEGLARTRCV